MFSRLRGKTTGEKAVVNKTTTGEKDANTKKNVDSGDSSNSGSSPPNSSGKKDVPETPRSRGLLGMFSSKGKQKQESSENTPAMTSSHQDENVIIFDWDDTLCPTWWVWNVLSFAVAGIELEEPIPADPKMQVILKTRRELCRPASRFCAELEEHAQTLNALLRTSRSLGRVSIVTMGSQPWFEASAVFFPGLDIPALLRELDISVHFAVIPEVVPHGTDMKVAAKRASITECLIRHYGINVVRWNVLSVGDQAEEREALKLCCASCPHRLRRRPICKTYTVEPEPMLKDITASLKRLTPAMARLVSYDRDNDWDFRTADF